MTESQAADVLAELREWISRHTQLPASPQAPAAYQRDFLIRVADEIDRLRRTNALLRDMAASSDGMLDDLHDEVEQLQKLALAQAERITAQSELLSRKAEREEQ